jgi:FtsK/SpoIIIE family.
MMANYKQRGLDTLHEQDQLMLLRDTRTLMQRLADFLSNPFNTMIILALMTVSMFFAPAAADIIAIIGFILFFYSYTRKLALPFRMPQVSGAPDHNDPLPGSNKPRSARGICFVGNDRRTNEELWFANDDMRTHMLIFGSTGSGKTEALVSIAYNALVQASGFIYIDGKGDNSLFAKVFSMCRNMGREDDFLLVNFMTGARDVIGPQEKRLSNTLNPFSLGSSSMLAQLIINLMDSGGQSGDGDMWKGRAISFVEALMKLLVYMRDAGHVLLDANIIRNYFHLDRLESIVMDKKLPRDKQEPVDISGIPDLVLEPITNYVLNLPGYDKSKKGKQVSQVLEQHGFITMQLGRVFTSLADTYGHILRVKLAEVDLRDVVLNRRIMVVLLPALEKSPAELSSLGKVIISSLKAMMAAGLGSEVEGTYAELIQRKPTNALTPFMCIMDEYGYYAVEGFAVVPAQARSLGFSAIFAGQDLPAFQKASKEEAASIGANTNIKICMKMEDPTDTWEFFSKTAGESYVTKVDTFQTNPQSMMNTYSDTRSASAEKRARIDLLDLKEQREGEAHIFFKSKIIRAKMFYADPKPAKFMRLNQFLKVDVPATKMLIELEERRRRLKELLQHPAAFIEATYYSEDIDTLLQRWKAQDQQAEPIERSAAVLLSYQEQIAEEERVEEIDETPFDELNIFAPYRLYDPTVPMIIGSNLEQFSAPILKMSDVRRRVDLIEKLTGRPSRHASMIAEELIKDLRISTYYPPDIVDKPTASELTALTLALAENIANKIASQNEGGADDLL